jgi:hypothetical protein
MMGDSQGRVPGVLPGQTMPIVGRLFDPLGEFVNLQEKNNGRIISLFYTKRHVGIIIWVIRMVTELHLVT